MLDTPVDTVPQHSTGDVGADRDPAGEVIEGRGAVPAAVLKVVTVLRDGVGGGVRPPLGDDPPCPAADALELGDTQRHRDLQHGDQRVGAGVAHRVRPGSAWRSASVRTAAAGSVLHSPWWPSFNAHQRIVLSLARSIGRSHSM